MEHKQAGWQSQEASILCINNCGFFGRAETMNMCSKCHRDMISKEQEAQIAASSIESIMNCSGSSSGKEPVVSSDLDIAISLELPALKTIQSTGSSISSEVTAEKVKEGPSRCSSCRKRVGLTGFTCRCGNLFCALHRHFEKHDCPYDYRESGRDAIAKANPVIKSDKLDRI